MQTSSSCFFYVSQSSLVESSFHGNEKHDKLKPISIVQSTVPWFVFDKIYNGYLLFQEQHEMSAVIESFPDIEFLLIGHGHGDICEFQTKFPECETLNFEQKQMAIFKPANKVTWTRNSKKFQDEAICSGIDLYESFQPLFTPQRSPITPSKGSLSTGSESDRKHEKLIDHSKAIDRLLDWVSNDDVEDL